MISPKFIQRFVKACQVVVLTGAAFKTDSILGNLFSAEKFSFKEERDASPQKFWKKINGIREKYSQVKPNLGHFALVDLESRFDEFTLITTSIDGLHRKAGNKRIIELKGNIFQERCQDCGLVFEATNKSDRLPVCPSCGGRNILPNLLQENEMPEKKHIKEAQRIAAEAEVFITAGFNDTNEEIKALPLIAKANGAYLLEITSEKDDLSLSMDETIIGNPAKILTAIVLILEKI